MSNVIMETVSKLTEVTPQPEDYMGEDGLLYCGKCRTPKQQYFPEWVRIPGMDRHPVDCDCEKVLRLKRETAELRRKHQAVVKEHRRRCFSNKRMESWNFENDNGNTPQMDYARRYVQYWDKVQADNIGYYLWGDPDCGKSYDACGREKFTMYEQYREGKITAEEYLTGKDELAKKQAALKEQLDECEAQYEANHQKSLAATEQQAG